MAVMKERTGANHLVSLSRPICNMARRARQRMSQKRLYEVDQTGPDPTIQSIQRDCPLFR
eukprot:4388472-Pleurochrysis_carterae.AAC.1